MLTPTRIVAARGSAPLDRLIPSLAERRAPSRDCSRAEVFQTSQVRIAGGIIGLGPRTISAAWQVTGRAAQRHHDTASAGSPSAAGAWDDLGIVLATWILTRLIPGGGAWLVGDDTRCHKRGAQVAFGGLSRDAVLSPPRPKALRLGLTWVVVGRAGPGPRRPDRSSCRPVPWRPDRTEGPAGAPTRPQAAAARARAEADPDRIFWPVGGGADVNAAVWPGRPDNRRVIGPLPREAARFERPGPDGGPGRPPPTGPRPPPPRAGIEDEAAAPAEVLKVASPTATREWRVPVIRDVPGYRGRETEPVAGVVVRDPAGEWREEAVVATDPTAPRSS